MPDPAVHRFAEHALATRFTDIPAAAVACAKVYLLDSLGVGIAGSSVEGGEALLQAAAGWGAPTKAAPAVPVWGRRERLAAPAAVFLNAWQMHNQEFDSLHEGAVVHALASVLPAALAAAEMAGGARGTELITAVAVGVDVAAGLGLAARSGFRFFRPATAGGFGATAAAGRLLGLDRAALARAFAWQLAQASGTMQAHVEGSPILPVQVAFNARAALQSCTLARLPFAAPESVFEGAYGYLPLFEGAFELDPVLRALGHAWRIAELSHKPYPAGRATHGVLEGVATLQRQHGFAAHDVAAVEVAAPPLIVRLVGRPPHDAMGASYARLCAAYAAARMLLGGRLDLGDFRGDALADRETLALARRITLRDDGTADPNALAPQTVVVRLHDGTPHRWSCPQMLAHPLRPLTTEQHLAKFRRCLDFAQAPLAADAARRLAETVDRLEELDDVRALAALAAAPE